MLLTAKELKDEVLNFKIIIMVYVATYVVLSNQVIL